MVLKCKLSALRLSDLWERVGIRRNTCGRRSYDAILRTIPLVTNESRCDRSRHRDETNASFAFFANDPSNRCATCARFSNRTSALLAIDPGNISARLAQQAQVETALHLLEKCCELKFIAAAAHVDRTDEMHAHGVTRCCGALSCNQW